MDSLAGRRIIVSGAASGMGAAMTEAFVREGARVAAFQHSRPVDIAKGAEVGDRVRVFSCNVADKTSVDTAVDSAARWLGGLDVLVHAAGIAPGAPAEDISLGEWEEVFGVNARSTMLTNQAAFRHLHSHGGAIINFASSTGVTGLAGKAHYAASKGAVLAWTRSIAREWGRYNITVNAIAPAIWTPMYQRTRDKMSPEQLAIHEAETARAIVIGGRLGDAERDFVPYMVFLAGPGARFITGQTIKIDGGLLMTS